MTGGLRHSAVEGRIAQGRVRFALVHLSGSRRGQTQEFEADHLTIGTSASNNLIFDPARDPAVSPSHAELSAENCELVLRDKGSKGGTFVNHQCVAEVILQDEDIITFGEGGPQVRIRIRPEAYAHCKPLRDILCDCRDIAAAARRGWLISAALFFRHLLSDLAFHATKPVRTIAGALVLLPVALLAGLLYSQYATRQAYERQISGLLSQIETGRLSQVILEKQVEEARQKATEFHEEQKKQSEALAAVLKRKPAEKGAQTEVTTLKQRLQTLETERVAGERIIKAFKGGVAFLQGTYGFVDKSSGRTLHYQGMDAAGAPLRDAEGHSLYTLEEEKPPVVVSFTGTGFLVDERGLLLTNRHVARIWEIDAAAQDLVKMGFEPRLLTFRAFFPGVVDPFEVSVRNVAERADVALLQFDPGPLKLPVLPLAPSDRPVAIGEPILLLGYPTGFDALLARADEKTSAEIVRVAGEDPDRLAQELANRGLIRSLATQGHVGDVLADRLIYDAQTTFGGSGGPVFNLRGEVIGVNYMILRRFGGANFAVPIRFGHEVLRGIT